MVVTTTTANEIKETCYKGTRILLGNEKRDMLNRMIEFLRNEKFMEISIPIIQFQDTFKGKIGKENSNLMFNFQDRKERNLCLAPEYTAVVQKLAKTEFKDQKNVRLFYIQECFRGEKPQAGRYRQFTQLGVEILNPTRGNEDLVKPLADLANALIKPVCPTCTFDTLYNTTRGLDYYIDGEGFEITSRLLGSQNQVCGGGEYSGGIGFAIGIDRLLLLNTQ